MNLRVKDAAALLNVSEQTVYRWASQAKLPFQRVNNQYRFSRAELLEWATSNQIPISPRLLEGSEDAVVPRLTDALRTGGIHYKVEGRDKPAVLRSVVNILTLPKAEDREYLYQVLLARESLSSTAVGDGIAIPHVRNPITLHVEQPLMALCFLKQPIDFQALDGRPVHTLFTIVSPTIKTHLQLLSRLSYGLRDSVFAEAVAKIDSPENILKAAGLLDDQLAESTPVEAKRPR